MSQSMTDELGGMMAMSVAYVSNSLRQQIHAALEMGRDFDHKSQIPGSKE